MNRALILAALLVFAPAAQASEAPPKSAEGGQFIAVSPVAIPIVVDGRLVNYVFVSVRIELSATANVTKLREKEPFFRDALVRAAHRTPFTLPSDLTKIDEAKLKASLMREGQAIAGPGQIRAIVVLNQTPKSLRVARQ